MLEPQTGTHEQIDTHTNGTEWFDYEAALTSSISHAIGAPAWKYRDDHYFVTIEHRRQDAPSDKLFIAKRFFYQVVIRACEVWVELLSRGSLENQQLAAEIREALPDLEQHTPPSLPEDVPWSIEYESPRSSLLRVTGHPDAEVNQVVTDLFTLDPSRLATLASEFEKGQSRGFEFLCSIRTEEDLLSEGFWIEPGGVEVNNHSKYVKLSRASLRALFAKAIPMYLCGWTSADCARLEQLATSFLIPEKR